MERSHGSHHVHRCILYIWLLSHSFAALLGSGLCKHRRLERRTACGADLAGYLRYEWSDSADDFNNGMRLALWVVLDDEQ